MITARGRRDGRRDGGGTRPGGRPGGGGGAGRTRNGNGRLSSATAGLAAPSGRWSGRVAGVKTWLDAWPVFRQLTGPDPLGRGAAARSKATENVVSRTATADRVVQSVCPYCAVGCGQRIYVKDEQIVQIEGDPDSPISRGRLCPKGSASKQLVTSPTRVTTVKYRRPFGTEWEDLDLDTAMHMIADRVLEARRKGWQDENDGKRDRKSTRLNSSHANISYAVFCLKKK